MKKAPPMKSEATPGREELLARLLELASLTGRGQLTQPRKVGREIADIALRLAAKPTAEPDVFGIAVHALTVGAPGIGPTIRDGIARSISMRVKAAPPSPTGNPKP